MQTVELVGRLFIALAVVLGVIWMIAKRARGSARQKLRSDKLIDVLGRQSLSRNSSVAVVRVAGQALIVGVTDSNVRVLGEVELDAVQAHIAATNPATRLTVAGSDSTETAEHDAVVAKRRVARFTPAPTGSPVTTSAQAAAAAAVTPGKLSGSALSPATWKQTIDALREMTARKG
jgi:flagellar protein FliO/FliZ